MYISNRGESPPVDFETAILNGFAPDGGLYVPEVLPTVNLEQLHKWKNLSYPDLAFEILSLFIDRSVMSESELKGLLNSAYGGFLSDEIIPMYKMKSRESTYIMELFHGPTLSFKDIGLAFLVNLFNFFLTRRKEFKTIIVATTGDTGPAAAHFAAGKSNLDAWVLYPKGMITPEQERQMTTLPHQNIHAVGVSNCPDGGDDLDLVIAQLFADDRLKKKFRLSSVNSINWGRIMMQTVHYFYGYLQVIDKVGDKINMSVPSGAFGNLCAGGIARKMGLPIDTFVAANNKNACLHRIFSKGCFTKREIFSTASSAIDILVPANFWRYLHFATGGEKSKEISNWIDEFNNSGEVHFDNQTFESYSEGFASHSTTDEAILKLIEEIYSNENYLLDPHGAVAVEAADVLNDQLKDKKTICLATAHPSKFPNVILDALGVDTLPKEATHFLIEEEKKKCEKLYLCNHSNLKEALFQIMESNWDLSNRNID